MNVSKPGLTAPELAAELGEPLDRLRKRLRKRADLQAFFAVLGGTRYVPTDRVPAFKAALLGERTPAAAG